MRCPFCAHLESKVTDSRTGGAGDVTRRRRECEECTRRFTTYERVEEVLPLVVKKDGRRESFDRQKLLSGLRRASEKRPVSLAQLEALVDAVERELMDRGEKELPATDIGERVMNHLRGVDDVAYVRFASVYRSFEDLGAFRQELDRLDAHRKSSPPAPMEPAPPER